MAVILLIETATSVCSAALSVNGKIIAFEESDESNVHAEKLAGFIQSVLKKGAFSFSDINAVAVGSGPGSYTGLRIGTSTAKGFCYGLNIPLISVSTLKAMCFGPSLSPQVRGQNLLYCPMIDARRMEVYTALYDGNGKEILPVHAKILDESSFLEYTDKAAIAFFGDGMPKFKALIPHRQNTLWVEDINASALNMATLAEEAYNTSLFEDLAYYEPFYLKDFVAKKKKGE